MYDCDEFCIKMKKLGCVVQKVCEPLLYSQIVHSS